MPESGSPGLKEDVAVGLIRSKPDTKGLPFFSGRPLCYCSRISPVVESVTTCHGIIFPLFFRAVIAAF